MPNVVFSCPKEFLFNDVKAQSEWMEADDIIWPEGWRIPMIGELVYARFQPNDTYGFHVKEVCWYPTGEDGDSDEPLVYVVLSVNHL